MKFNFNIVLTALVAAGGVGCGDPTPVDPQKQALTNVKTFITGQMTELADASARLQAAAPAPDADGWNAVSDAAALATMKTEWKRARVSYEHIEGAIAVLFGEIDYSTDQRYDAFLTDNGPDANLFDDQNVTGVHAIERILWSNQVPARALAFEEALTGFTPPAFPATMQQASDFKSKLCGRLVADVQSMRDQFGPLVLDSSAAFRGVIGSLGEQLEKAELAADGAEESRYAAFTLADMRANVDAGVATFQAFRPWLRANGGDQQIAEIEGAFGRVKAAYAALSGDALPPIPETWDAAQPSASDLQTPFGMLWTVLHHEADPDIDGTLVSSMNDAAEAMGIPQLPE
jgi:iron uptake system component EfeO